MDRSHDQVQLGDVQRLIEVALHEDLAAGDVTTRATVAPGAHATAKIIAKEACVLCGQDWLALTFAAIDASVQIERHTEDGVRVEVGTCVATLRGSARSILAGERTALNLLQRGSGVATMTRAFVDAAGGRCRIVDTRKTTPGMRAAERYAVRVGGGHNHRNDLGSGVLIKENHIRCAGSVGAAIEAARGHAPHTMRVECEVTSVAELEQALAAGADIVMLDNFSDGDVAAAVKHVNGRALVEVSGGITLDRVPVLAAAGVDVISVGALTHSAPASDLSMLVEVQAGA